MVKASAQTVNVSARVKALTEKLFRRNVLRSPYAFMVPILQYFRISFGQSQVSQFGLAFVGQDYVSGFYVSVNQLLFVPGIINSFGHLLSNSQGTFRRQTPTVLQHLFHGITINLFHGKVEKAFLLAYGDGLHDVAVHKLGSRPGFRHEFVDEFLVFCILFMQYLQRHGAVERLLMRLVHSGHPAAAEFLLDDEISPHDGTGSQRVGRSCKHLAATGAFYRSTGLFVIDVVMFLTMGALKTHFYLCPYCCDLFHIL